MLIKCNIEIVVGVRGSGKTHFINRLLQNTLSNKERILVIYSDDGNEKVGNYFQYNNKNLEVFIGDFRDTDNLISIIRRLSPHRVIIEANPGKDFIDLLSLLRSSSFEKHCKVTKYYALIDGENYDFNSFQIKEQMLPYAKSIKYLIINNADKICQLELEKLWLSFQMKNRAMNYILVNALEDVSEKLMLEKCFKKPITQKSKGFIKNYVTV